MSPTSFASEVPTLVLEPDDRAPGLARRFLADWFREWGSRDDYIGRVLVSELVTNSCVHGEGPVVVRVFRDERDGGAVIEVWDGGNGRPVVCAEDVQATSGRGVFMVSELALSWGTRPLVEGGKVTWAKCGL